jgi:hypothetical protein
MKIPVPEGLQLPPDNGGMVTLTAEFKLDDGGLELVSLEGVPVEMEEEEGDEEGGFMAAVERGLAQPS